MNYSPNEPEELVDEATSLVDEGPPCANSADPDRRLTGAFLRYTCGEVISMIGSWMQVAAQAFVMTTLTTEAKWFGVLQFASGIPMVLLTLGGGSLADRYDKRKILWVCQIIQMILAVSIGYLIEIKHIAYWHLLVSAVLVGTVTAFEVPTASAFVPELVTKDRIQKAIAIDRGTFHASRLFGPAAAGICIAHFGTSSVFYLNALTYLALIFVLFTISPRPMGGAAEQKLRATGIVDGLKYVRHNFTVLAMILLCCMGTIFAFPFLITVLPLYATHVLGLEAAKMGYLIALSATGSLLGVLLMVTLGRHHRLRLLVGASILASLAMLGLTIAPTFRWAAISLIFIATGLSTNFGLAMTIIQERVPDVLRGRVSAVANMSFFGLLPFTALIISNIADLVGIRNSMAGGAICYGLSTLAILLLTARRTNLERVGVRETKV